MLNYYLFFLFIYLFTNTRGKSPSWQKTTGGLLKGGGGGKESEVEQSRVEYAGGFQGGRASEVG